ncbi:hypothetical protein Tco_1185430 [Tanacetum coccineum]
MLKPKWKPTGRRYFFALYDNCPLTRIMEPIVEPLELTLRVSSSSKVTMISRFPDCNLSDRKGKAGPRDICILNAKSWSKGRTVADSIAARLTRPTAYKFKTDCSIIPVWDPIHKEQVEEILNHLDKLSLDRIEYIEDKIEGIGNGRAAIKKLVADSVTTALEAQVATMASTSNPNSNIRPTGTPVAKRETIKSS